MTDPLPGITRDTVGDWLDTNIDAAHAPFVFELIPAGGSNLTYRVRGGNGYCFILRRPPVSARIATAHDMAREYKIMAALQSTEVPVPRMLAYCSDTDVTGAEFYCMEMVEGVVLDSREAAQGMTPDQCRSATHSLIDAQIAFHQVDLSAIGLNDLARHDGYLQRQLKRWKMQVDNGSDRQLSLLAELHDELCNSIPAPTTAPGLAHGDYRFDNTILRHVAEPNNVGVTQQHYRVAAVLDWELCTIGDPLADFIWSLNYWAEPGDTLHWLQDPPTQYPNFPNRQYVIDYYAEKSGIAIDNLPWYNAFSWWKQACIVEGVLARLRKGASGGMAVASHDRIEKMIDDYLTRAKIFLQAHG